MGGCPRVAPRAGGGGGLGGLILSDLHQGIGFIPCATGGPFNPDPSSLWAKFTNSPTLTGRVFAVDKIIELKHGGLSLIANWWAVVALERARARRAGATGSSGYTR